MATCSKKNWYNCLVGFLLLAGFILSFVGILRLCTESCVDTHDYRLFRLPFEPIGLVFFTICLLTLLFSQFYLPLKQLLTLLVIGSLGAEIKFIMVQKYEMGEWCPVCLTIAGCLFLAGTLLACEFVKQPKKILLVIVTVLLGFSTAYLGVTKEESFPDYGISFANGRPMVDQKKPVEVYIITDWFCEGCRHIEPIIRNIFPQMSKQASITFVDFAVHPESVNYTPYNLSFIINEKKKYLAIREALQMLSYTTKQPSVDDIQSAVAPLKVKYRPLQIAIVDNGMNFFDGIVKTYNVHSTPSIVVVNNKTNKSKLIHGSEITEEEVLKVIREMAQR